MLTNKIDTSIVSLNGQIAADLAVTTNIKQLFSSNQLSMMMKNKLVDGEMYLDNENERSVLTPNINDLEMQLLEASKSGDLDVVKVS